MISNWFRTVISQLYLRYEFTSFYLQVSIWFLQLFWWNGTFMKFFEEFLLNCVFLLSIKSQTHLITKQQKQSHLLPHNIPHRHETIKNPGFHLSKIIQSQSFHALNTHPQISITIRSAPKLPLQISHQIVRFKNQN